MGKDQYSPESDKFSSLRIVVLEDEKGIIGTLKQIFTEEVEIKAEFYTSPEQFANGLLNAKPPDVVLMDFNMGGEGLRERLERLNMVSMHSNTVCFVIPFTANDGNIPKYAKAAEGLPHIRISKPIPKPFDVEDLLETLKNVTNEAIKTREEAIVSTVIISE